MCSIFMNLIYVRFSGWTLELYIDREFSVFGLQLRSTVNGGGFFSRKNCMCTHTHNNDIYVVVICILTLIYRIVQLMNIKT